MVYLLFLPFALLVSIFAVGGIVACVYNDIQESIEHKDIEFMFPSIFMISASLAIFGCFILLMIKGGC